MTEMLEDLHVARDPVHLDARRLNHINLSHVNGVHLLGQKRTFMSESEASAGYTTRQA
jgi:hypothetical protein